MGSGNTDITLIYFLGTIGMMLLAGGLFFFFVFYQKRLLQKQLELNKVKQDQQEQILKNTIEAQENERRRIAQDLHDEVGAMLSVVKLNVGRIEKRSEEKSRILASETKTYLDDVITQVRRISRALLPPALEKLGLYPALEELVNWVNKSDQLHIFIQKTGEAVRFDSKKELAVFRVIQELMNNTIKHAGASHLTLILRFGTGALAVLVRDNGKGFDIRANSYSGLGLKNLQSRIDMAGGTMKLKSKIGVGTTAILLLNTNE
ncbi:MAG: sensor histidine kinase [Draconibacterium sp.]